MPKKILCNMPLLPRICTFGIGLHRVSFRFSHPLAHSSLRLLPASSSSCRLPTIPQYRSVSTDERIKQLEQKCSSDPEHFKKTAPSQAKTEYEDYTMAHPIWSAEETNEVEITHQKPSRVSDWAAYITVQMMRKGFDLFSGYTIKSWMKSLDERDMLRRCIFLETVAGVPGFAAAMIRHLQSLRRMQRDNGWIHTLLEEAENERMHLMTFLALKQPGRILRFTVAGTQIIFTGFFSLAYLISPHFCHRFVGYLDEQAVVTYTHILEEIDAGRLPMWRELPAPKIAVNYWKLPPTASMRDVILVIRADEANHRLVNHTLASMDLKKKNPFKPGE